METLCVERSGGHFIDRISKYPVVTDTYGKVFDYYSWAKDKNHHVKTGLDFAESTLQAVVSKAQPVLQRLDRPIGALDKFSCHQLDKLEEKCPIICEPTGHIAQKTKDLYETGVKQRVSGLVNPIVKPVSTTVSTICSGASTIAHHGLATMTYLSTTTPGKVAVSRLNDALDLADRSVDRYLPPTEEEKSSEESPLSLNEASNEEKKVVQKRFVVRAGSLSNKIRRRMYVRAMKDIKHLKLRSEEALKEMTHSVDLIAYARTHFETGKEYSDQLTSEWHDAMLELEDQECVSEEELYDGNVERVERDDDIEPTEHNKKTERLLTSARFWAHRLRLASTAIGMVSYRHLPENVQGKVNVATAAANNLFNQLRITNRVQDLQQSFVEGARHAIGLINEHISVAFEYLTTTAVSSWLPSKEPLEDIEMEAISPLTAHESQSSNEDRSNYAISSRNGNEHYDHENIE